jgi:AcrR family transcriptional regulator
MARPRSEEKRLAILAAATRVVGTLGMSAPTAMIAKEAGVSNGSLFSYFETKAELMNLLYVELKAEMAVAALDGLPTDLDIRAQSLHMWSQLLRWAIAFPAKYRTLANLAVSSDISADTKLKASQEIAGMLTLLELGRKNGPLRDAPLEFVATLMIALMNATIDYTIHDPVNTDTHCTAGFEAFWRVIA